MENILDKIKKNLFLAKVTVSRTETFFLEEFGLVLNRMVSTDERTGKEDVTWGHFCFGCNDIHTLERGELLKDLEEIYSGNIKRNLLPDEDLTLIMEKYSKTLREKAKSIIIDRLKSQGASDEDLERVGVLFADGTIESIARNNNMHDCFSFDLFNNTKGEA